MRLIDADALKEVLIKEKGFYPAMVASAIDNAPTITVKRGTEGGMKHDRERGYRIFERTLFGSRKSFEPTERRMREA